MWVVQLYGERHSAWKSQAEANHQANVLAKYGYRPQDIKLDFEAFLDCENGHYFM